MKYPANEVGAELERWGELRADRDGKWQGKVQTTQYQ